MQQCVRGYLFAPGSGYALGDWREMSSCAHFFINESSVRMPLHIVLYDDCERVEIVERSRGDTHVVRVANADELLRFLGSHVPTGPQLEYHRSVEQSFINERDQLEAIRLVHIEAAEACVMPEDVARLAATVADSMRVNLQVISCAGRRNVVNKTLYMLRLALEASLPAPTEF